jgi:hypothetical protein
MAVRVAVLTERQNYPLCGTVYTQAWVPARVFKPNSMKMVFSTISVGLF